MAFEKILIADDEPYVLDICRRVLRGKYQVEIVRSGVEAIQIAQNERFDLLLTDIKMPGIDGLETAREMKKIHPDIVCITMTGFSTMETAIKALRLGVDEFIIKPFSPDELILAVEHALEKERLRQENIRLKSLLPLFEFNKSLMSIVDTTRLLKQVLNLVLEETEADQVILCVIDEAEGSSQLMYTEMEAESLRVFEEFCPKFVEAARLKNAQMIVVEEDTASFLPEARQNIETEVEEPDDVDAKLRDLLSILQLKSVVATPLLGKEALLGVLLLTKQDQLFTKSECNFLSVVTGQAAIAYQNARLFENLQQAYDELKTLDHMKSEFTNRAAHELRTPLAILMGYAGVLVEDVRDKVHKGYLEIIVRNSLRLRSLIEDLLNMRYIETGQLSLTISEVNVNQIINEVIHDMSILAGKKHITLSSKIEEPLPVIQSDHQKVELIIMNLLANAIKFTPYEGQIWINGRVKDNAIEIAVADTGIGISKGQYSRIFDSFYQIEDSLSRKHEGIGLGLAISKGMIERCGGTIWVESEIEKGSRFIFTIPLEAPDHET